MPTARGEREMKHCSSKRFSFSPGPSGSSLFCSFSLLSSIDDTFDRSFMRFAPFSYFFSARYLKTMKKMATNNAMSFAFVLLLIAIPIEFFIFYKSALKTILYFSLLKSLGREIEGASIAIHLHELEAFLRHLRSYYCSTFGACSNLSCEMVPANSDRNLALKWSITDGDRKLPINVQYHY